MSCCIRRCGTTVRRPSPNGTLSHHEIPSYLELRARWLAVINREGWQPSCYSKVCSLHFEASDFVEGKRRRLKKGVVPSIFLDDQASLIAALKDKIRRKCSGSDGTSASAKTRRLDADSPVTTNSPVTTDSAVMANSPVTTNSLVMTDDPMMINSHVTTSSPEMTNSSAFILGVEYVEESPGSFGPPGILLDRPEGQATEVRFADKSMQADFRGIQAQTYPERRKWARQIKDLNVQVERLRNTAESYKRDLQEVMEDTDVATFLTIREEAKEGRTAAAFLMDQVTNFYRRCPRWTDDTVRHCARLRDVSALVYEHIRSKELLKLPSRNALKRQSAEFDSGGAGIVDIVEADPELQPEEHSIEDASDC
uniref:THAP-type domain-containing protein n=1 Tax=Ixodes ricinus TaxID=34613 RepID=A0A147BCL3_IXORI